MVRSVRMVLISVIGVLVLLLCAIALNLFLQPNDNQQSVETEAVKPLAQANQPVANTGISTLVQVPPRRVESVWTNVINRQDIDQTLWPNVPDHAVFVDLNGHFQQWLLGTPVNIQIPQTGKTYAARVDRITPNGSSSTTIHAAPTEEESELERLILTFSADQTLAYISSHQGNWELNGDSQTGWLVSSAKLNRSRDYSESDVRIRDYDRYANAEYVPRRTD